MRGLADKVVVVAGGATGIGAQTAVRLAEEGATVVVADVNEAGAKETADRVTASGAKATAVAFDISGAETAVIGHLEGGRGRGHATAAR